MQIPNSRRISRQSGWAVIALALTTVSTFADNYVWKNVTIKGGGFVSGIVTHPNAPGVMYARTDIGGAYRWSPDSNSWIPLLDFAADANVYGIESLAIDPSDSNRLYIAASRNAPNGTTLKYIFSSTNQGATFTSSTPPFTLDGNYDGRSCGERLAVDPNLGSILLYSTRNSKLYKSVNSGVSWTQISFPVTTTANGIGLVFVDFVKSSGTPGNATPTIYVGVSRTGTNLFRSIDGGASWAGVSTGIGTNYLCHHVAQDGLGNMFVTLNNNQGPNNITDGKVVKLNLSTLTVTDVTPIKFSGEQGGFAGVSVDRENPYAIAVSTMDRWWAPAPYAPWDQIYRSTNGGASWVETMPATLPDSTSAPWSVARNPHWAGDVEIDPFNSDRVYFITGYGVIGTTNFTAIDSGKGVKWAFMSDGIEETVPLGLVSPPSGPNLLSAHGDIGAFRHYNLDVSPPLTDYFSTHRVTSYGIDVAWANPNIIARLFNDSAIGGAYSVDGGTTWQDFAAKPATFANGAGGIAVSADGSRFVWMPQNSVAYYSANNGASWTASTGGPTATRVPVADRVNPNKFYIYSGTRMYVSTDGGATYTAGGTTTGSNGGPPCAVFGNEGHVFLPLPNGLWRTTDSGATFTQLPAVQQASYVGAGKPAPGQSYPALYILGQISGISGIYRSDDQGTNWIRINDDQHQFGLSWVHDFCADPQVYGRVYFGTEGRGVIHGDLAAASVPYLQSLGITNGLFTLQVTNSLAGPNYSIQASTNLVDWTEVFTTNAAPASFQWTDPAPASAPMQYYRVQLLP